MSLFRRLLFVVFCLLFASTVFAQEDRGRISGVVADSTGAVIPTAKVTLLNESTNVSQTVNTNETGAYLFDLLIPDLYTVTIDAPGFKESKTTHVRVEVASRVSVNGKLDIGSTTEQVTVNEHGVVLKTSEATLGYTVEYRSLEDLPTLYGNAFELQLLQPGVISTTLANGNHDYEGGSESTKVNGAQSGQTEFTIDGAPDTRNGGAVTTAFIPSHEFVGEFKLITSPYDASLAHTSGSSLDSDIKAGTDHFHGGGSFYWQPGTVNARGYSFSNAAVYPTSYSRESAYVGGPLLHDKLFFFTGYEHEHNQQGFQSVQTVPTVAERTGDFSALYNLGLTQTQTVCGSTIVENKYELYDPFTTTPAAGCPGVYMRSPMVGDSGQINVIKSAYMNPIASKILAYYPLPTPSSAVTADGQDNFVFNGANIDKYWSFVERTDYNLSPTQKLFGHFIYSSRIQPGKNEYFPGASGQTLTLANRGVVLDYVNTLNSATVLNVRYSFTRFLTTTLLDAKTTTTDLGLPADIMAQAPAIAQGFPEVEISGYGTLESSDPSVEYDNVNDGAINLTRAQGRHTLKFGVEYRKYQANSSDYTGAHAVLATGGAFTTGPYNNSTIAPEGAALASFEAGVADTSTQSLGTSITSNTSYWTTYLQDDWKLSPKLTLNMGVRYEYGSPISERHDKSIAGFAFNTPNPIATAAMANYAANPSALLPAAAFQVLGGVQYAGTAADPKSGLWNAPKDLFSPRFGFAYNPIPNLVVRGGFGIFYSHAAEYIQYANPMGYAQKTAPTYDVSTRFSPTAEPLSNPFPNGLVQEAGNTNGMYQGLNSTIQFYPQSQKAPYNERWSLGIQYQLPGEMVFEANYVGSDNYHVQITRDYDGIPLQYLSRDTTRTAAQVANYNALTKSYANPFAGIPLPTGAVSSAYNANIAQSQLLKPYPEFSDVEATKSSAGGSYSPTGYSTYNSLQTELSKRFSHGYNMSIAYTWSKSLDAVTFLNASDPKPWYGLSSGDYPQVLAIAGIYELPFGHNKPFFANTNRIVNQVISGFQLNGTYRLQSGQPITFGGTGSGYLLNPGYTYSDIGKVANKSLQHWFNTAAIDTNASDQLEDNYNTFPLRFGNVRESNLDILNLGAERKFHIHNEIEADFKLEAINALNHTVFSSPNTTPTSTAFGVVSGVGNSARVLTFGFEGHF